jgi:hypothetical protein
VLNLWTVSFWLKSLRECNVMSLSEQYWHFTGVHDPEDENTLILLNVRNYSPNDSITSQKTHMLSNTAWRKLNFAIGSFVKCLLYKEGSCEGLEFSKNFVSYNHILINSNMTLLCWIDSFNSWEFLFLKPLLFFFRVPIHLTYSTVYRIL